MNLRLFVAVDISEAVRDRLAETMRLFRRATQSTGLSGNWVKPENLHVTLKFLGSTPEERLPEIQARLNEATRDCPPFELSIPGLRAVPNTRRPRMIWANGHEGTGALEALHAKVEQALAPLGFAPENRAFSPHLTLARLKSSPDLIAYLRPYSGQWNPPPPVTDVREITLYRSETRPEGSIYTPVSRFALRGDKLLSQAG